MMISQPTATTRVNSSTSSSRKTVPRMTNHSITMLLVMMIQPSYAWVGPGDSIIHSLSSLPPAQTLTPFVLDPLPTLTVAKNSALSMTEPVRHLLSVAEHSPAAFRVSKLLSGYTQSLLDHPLSTKMMTGGLLATIGDAIGQITQFQSQQQQVQQSQGDVSKMTFSYDGRRAFSFMLFDMSYRAVQHASFPFIVQTCQGQFLGPLVSLFLTLTATANMDHSSTYYYSAVMEQTLASQLGIVPFFYYPIFFGLTGFIQGLSTSESIQRAQEKFIPLMQRNLCFWIPVQFIQFGFIAEQYQIPFLSVAGLCWTIILSVMAGSAASSSSTTAPITPSTTEEELEQPVMWSPTTTDTVTASLLEQQQPTLEDMATGDVLDPQAQESEPAYATQSSSSGSGGYQ